VFHRPSLHGQKGTLGTAKPVISTASSTRKNVVPMKLGTRKPAHVYACPLLAQKVRSLWTVSACALTRTALADSTSIRPPVSACANHTNVHRTTTSTPKRAPASAVSHKERTPAFWLQLEQRHLQMRVRWVKAVRGRRILGLGFLLL